jgi:glycosyltransferase involved in cell wall biosynthesis
MPRITIGLPVYNGENFITDALDSILGQTYRDFELIISDNASTDRTKALCESYAAMDSRIRYIRNQENLGAALNYNRVFGLSSGKYFKWAAHDDTLAPEYLEKCVEVLDRDPSIVLVYTLTQLIDEHGIVVGAHEPDTRGFDSEKPHERFRSRISRIRPQLPFIPRKLEDPDPIFGLIRASALKDIQLFGTCIASDQVLLARLALLGRFERLPEGLFYNRDHPQRFVYTHPSRYSHARWYGPARAANVFFPDWTLFSEFLLTIRQSRLTRYQKARCYPSMARYLFWNWPRLARDILMAARPVVGRAAKTLGRASWPHLALSKAFRFAMARGKPIKHRE